MLKLRSRKAFTLLELVVALVVLGILAALAVPTYISVIDNAKVATATSSAISVATDAVAIASDSESVADSAAVSTALGETNGQVTLDGDYSGTGVGGGLSVVLDVTNNGNTECIGITFGTTVNAPPTATGAVPC